MKIYFSGDRIVVNIEKRIRVLIVEDHIMMAEFMTDTLNNQTDIFVVAAANNASEAVSKYRQYKPDIAIIDLGIPGVNEDDPALPQLGGLEAIRAIKKFDHDSKILVLTAQGRADLVHKSFRAGANGYLLKGEKRQTLVDAIHTIYKNGKFVSQPLATEIISNANSELTEQEFKVLRLLPSNTTTAIAKHLEITESGVRWHISKILYKLGTGNRTLAIDKARKMGLLNEY